MVSRGLQCHYSLFLYFPLGSKSDSNGPAPSSEDQSAMQGPKKSILIGKRPALAVSSMINQFKNYSQSKQTTVVAARPSVFSSPDDDEDEEEEDAHYLEVKGITACLSLSHHRSDVVPNLNHPPCVMDVLVCCIILRGVLIACLKFPPQRMKTSSSSPKRWPCLSLKEERSWRRRSWRTTKTILSSRTFPIRSSCLLKTIPRNH